MDRVNQVPGNGLHKGATWRLGVRFIYSVPGTFLKFLCISLNPQTTYEIATCASSYL